MQNTRALGWNDGIRARESAVRAHLLREESGIVIRISRLTENDADFHPTEVVNADASANVNILIQWAYGTDRRCADVRRLYYDH